MRGLRAASVLSLLLLLLGAGDAEATQELLTLQEALARARSNARIDQARAEAAAAAARVDQARAGHYPFASGLLSLGPGSGHPGTPPGRPLARAGAPGLFYGAAVELSQKIWDFGQTAARARAAGAASRAAQSDAAAVWADVALDVRIAYYNALAARAFLGIADERVASSEKHLDAAEELVRVGKRPQFDVTKSEIDLSTARVARLEAWHAVVESRLALAAAIGVDDLAGAVLERPPTPVRPDPAVADVLAQAMARRPELSSLDARLFAQQSQVDARRNSFWPSLSAGGQVAIAGVEQPGGRTVPSWHVGLQLAVPLLAGGADRARLREERAVLRGLEAARATVALHIRVEAQQLVNGVTAASARQEAAAAIVVQARENLAIAEGRYRAGVANIIELADAQSTLTSAEAQQARAEFELEVARARLERAVGGSD